MSLYSTCKSRRFLETLDDLKSKAPPYSEKRRTLWTGTGSAAAAVLKAATDAKQTSSSGVPFVASKKVALSGLDSRVKNE